MSRTYKDTKQRGYTVLTGKRAGNPEGCSYGCCGWWRKGRLYKKHTAKVERQRDERLVREGINHYYEDPWSGTYFWHTVEYENWLSDTEYWDKRILDSLEFLTDPLTNERTWGILYEFTGRYSGFHVVNAWKWDGTVEVNLTQLVKEITP